MADRELEEGKEDRQLPAKLQPSKTELGGLAAVAAEAAMRGIAAFPRVRLRRR
jgi:hypothetical protein